MKEMPIRPLFDKVIVRPESPTEVSKGGIHIPGAVQEKTNIGIVTAVGAGKKNTDGSRFPMEVKVGDKILFMKNAGSTLKLEGGEFLMLVEEEILGVFEKEKESK